MLAASLVAHALVLGVLGLRAVRMDAWRGETPPVVLIDITPRPMLEGERPRERNYAAPPAPEATDQPRSLTTPRPGLIRRDEDEDDTPDAPSAGTGAPGAPQSSAADPGVDEAWRVPAGPTRRQLGRSLRGSMIGCDAMRGRLSAGEQAQCDEAFNRAAGAAPPIGGSGDAERDARFAAQGRREMEAYEARRRPLAGGTGLGEHGDCPGSNFGTGCPGRHLDRGWRRDNNDVMSGAQGGRER
ncbi:MAG TPA: hypothetical protein VGR32_01925 [Brevundimonas sp.]|uniref:hypothetical protein n=1 Tax=Brevundimonas sp. TaxID=1871086 RepID=UPI002DE221AC|nr:hypothetical protein [Brevundimonas sp.]